MTLSEIGRSGAWKRTKELCAAVWQVVMNAACVMMLILSSVSAHKGDYAEATYSIALIILVRTYSAEKE